MRLVLALCVGLAVMPSASAFAAGMAMSWSDCDLGPTARTNVNFACDTNDGSHLLVGSFVPPPDFPLVAGMEAIIELNSESCPMPDWWQFMRVGACRQTALSSIAVPQPGQAACGDLWQGQAITFVNSYEVGFGANYRRVRIGVVAAVPIGLERPVSPGTQYYAFNLAIQNTKTVGSGACTGCSEPVCMMLVEIILYRPQGMRQVLPLPLGYNWETTWQGGSPICFGTDDSLPACATPVVTHTWGQIKSLYR